MAISGKERDAFEKKLEAYVGLDIGVEDQSRNPINEAMIRQWCEAMGDENPIYLDTERAGDSAHGGIVAPPAMLQAWTMPRPKIEGIAERGGAPGEMNPDGPIPTLDRAGFVGTLATNSELEFFRYLKPGDHLRTTSELESISVRKKTGLGEGYFITWITRYFDQENELVGQQLFRILKFDPSTIDLSKFGGAQ